MPAMGRTDEEPVSTQEQFWRDYYVEIVEKGNLWLDYSNERVQAQTFALALEAAGPVRSKQCIDIGCGWGDFCCTLSALQASTVTGVDIVRSSLLNTNSVIRRFDGSAGVCRVERSSINSTLTMSRSYWKFSNLCRWRKPCA